MTLTKAAPPSQRPPKKLRNLEKVGKQRPKGGGRWGGEKEPTAGLQNLPDVANSGQSKAESSLVIHTTAGVGECTQCLPTLKAQDRQMGVFLYYIEIRGMQVVCGI